jgi:hypothetical protein
MEKALQFYYNNLDLSISAVARKFSVLTIPTISSLIASTEHIQVAKPI